MAGCTPGFTEVARQLGGIDCAAANAVMSVRDPSALTNWTLLVVEVLMVAGSIAALVHAVRRLRRHGDPTNLGLWCAAVVYVLLLEPPLYFPDRFGLAEYVDLIFVHNLFTVQFMFDRLPLYIVALYPALTCLAYALVQATGILERRNPLVGAACVAFAFHGLYEIFDHIGPQLRWWAWNPDAPTNLPWLASVPLTSVVIFAGASPFGMALFTQLLIARRAAEGRIPGPSLALRAIAVGALTPLAMVVVSAPYGIVGSGREPNTTAQGAVLWVELVVLITVAVPAFAQAAERHWSAAPDAGPRDWYPAVAGSVYLLVFAVLWLTALPDHLDATGGRTEAGTPTGSLAYVVIWGLVSLAVVYLAWPPRTRADAAAEPGRAPALDEEPADRTA